MEDRLLHSVLLLVPVVRVCLEGLPGEEGTEDHVDGCHEGHEGIGECVHDGDIGDACCAEGVDDDDDLHCEDDLLVVLDEPGVCLGHGVVSDEGGEREDEHEDRDDVLGSLADGGAGDDILHQGCTLGSDGQDLVVTSVGEDDEGGDGTDDQGVDEDTEGLDLSLLDRVGDVRGCGEVCDGTETGLVREDSSLQTGDDDDSDSSAEHGLPVECVLEDHDEGVDDSADVETDGDDGEDDPCDGHDGDDLGRELRDHLESLEDEDGGDDCDDCCEHEVVVVEGEGSAEGGGCVTGLDTDESDTEGQDEKDGGEDTELPASETLLGVVGRSSVELSVGLLLLVDLCKGGLHEGACRSDDGEDPHPEDRSGSSGDDGGCNSSDVTYTDTGTHSDTESFEGGDLLGVSSFLDSGECER